MFVQYFDSIPNTNSLLMELSKKSAKSWTAVWTAEQTEGRGYTGNRWLSEPGKNIALSLLIINELSYRELVYFNQWIANVVAGVLEQYTDEVFVKWPNDIIILNKKVCGILIETRKFGDKLFIISGIGLNVNQHNFERFPKAGSLSLKTGQTYDLNRIVSDILTALEENYSLIEHKEWQKIRDHYVAHLFQRNELSAFKCEDEIFNAFIKGVSEEGELIVEMENGAVRHFAHKAVELLY